MSNKVFDGKPVAKPMLLVAMALATAAVLALAGCGASVQSMKATSHEGQGEVTLTAAKTGENVFVPMVFDADEAVVIEHSLVSGTVKVEVASTSSSSSTAVYTSEELSGDGEVVSDVIGEGTYRVRVTVVSDASGTVELTVRDHDEAAGEGDSEGASGAVLGAEMPIDDSSKNWSATTGNDEIAKVSSDGAVTGDDGSIEGALFTVTPGGTTGTTTVTFSLAPNDDPDAVEQSVTYSLSVSDEDTGTLMVTDYSGPDEYKDLLKAQ